MKIAHDQELTLDLNLLAVFDSLLRERSVTKAAATLGITQSATSHALNRLRHYFNDQLFVKSQEGMTPTHKAQSLAPAVLEVMESIRGRLLSAARFDPTTARRTFNLCMTDMGELVFLPPLVHRLRKEAPHCSLRTVQVPVDQIEGLLATGDADLALGSIRSAPEGLFRQRLFMHSFLCIVSARNNSVGSKLTLEQFEQMQHIVVSLSGKESAAYDSELIDHGIRRRVFLTTPHFLIVPLLLEQHPDMIATVPEALADTFGKYGSIRVLQPPVSLPPFALNQHWHPRFHHDPAIVWLRELIRQTFETYPEVRLSNRSGSTRQGQPSSA